jgi:hypothetical protein
MTASARVATKALAAVLTAVLGLVGCGGGGGGGDTAPASEVALLPAVGPIPGAEFATVPPPTFNQAIAAFRKVTAANPALLGDEPALSRALFDEVRRTTTGVADGRAGALRVTRQALFNLDARLTLEEWKVVIRSPINSARAAGTIEVSAQAAVDRLPCDADIAFIDGKADALRHAYWSALMTRRTTAAFAEVFATAHETGSTNSAEASAMDLHNNAFGRAMALSFPAASDDQLLQMLLQQSFTLVPAGAPIPAALRGLVYIAERARRPFDGAFAGTLTALDAGGGTWSLELNLTQCGAALAGHYQATRGPEVIERRFTGTLTSTTSMTLEVAEPFAFEAAAAQNPCRGMMAVLVGNERELSGPWTSPTCPQGGIIAIGR